jgi:putative two-component system response regulator
MFIVIVDDVALNNVLMEQAVSAVPGGEPRVYERPAEALAFIQGNMSEVGVLVTDYDMPGMNGLELVAAARGLPGFEHVPVLMVTSMAQRSLRNEALAAGVTDFLGKPFDAVEVKARVTNLLRLRRALRDLEDRSGWLAREVEAATREIEAREQELVTRLVRATEHRDSDTGDHVSRVSRYVSLIARNLGIDGARCRKLALASTMHDIGKISVPDSILLKRGPLTPEERRLMTKHAASGYAVLEGSSSDVVNLAAEIALSHHERWDGAGYPTGLAGEAIPLSGRIVAVADVFDALVSDRPYKIAWSLDNAREHLLSERGRHFDPACVDAFVAGRREVLRIASGERRLVA